MDTLKLFYAGLAYFDEGSVRAAAFGSLADLLKTGCTTTCDMHYVFPAAAKNAIDWELETAAQLGIRMHVLRGSLTTSAAEGCWYVPQPLVESPDTIARDCVRVIERYHDRSFGAMTRVGIAPCWLLYEDPTALRVCQELSETYHVPLHSHLADSRDEFTYAKERYGCTPVEYAERIGYLAPGMMADLVLLDWDQIQYAGGKYDPIYAAVLSGDARMVDTVFVNGRMVVKRGHLKTADEAQVNTYINQQTARMVARWQGA